MAGARTHPESRVQRDIRAYLAVRGFASVHVPNGSKLHGTGEDRARQWRNLAADGAMVGFPDLLVYAPGGRIGHMEVKTPTGAVQDTQRACQLWLEGLGHHYAIVRSYDDVDAALRDWGWKAERTMLVVGAR